MREEFRGEKQNLYMGDRRTEVNHPASGKTSFTYNPLGNVLTKQTANMAEEGKMITYTYDYHRLTGINYPDHPENNVKYYYGGRNASHNRIGRLMMREDGTGAIEYFYGKMGEVTKTRRTLIVPNQAVATYVTQWKYDSHNRLLEMIYPDEEKVTYGYNLGGQVDHVSGYKSYGYDYVSKIGYDKFEQRTYLKYCNGAETFYNNDYKKMQFYYHPDHLGSSSYITNLDGEVMQHIEYVPYGEVFIDELELTRKSAAAGKANCNNTWNTPYRFNDCANEGRGKLACSMPSAANRRVELNAKEFDEETGLYYYGARYYEPRLSLWMTCDPLQEKYINISTYCYTFNRPVVLIDPNGEFPILPIVKGIIKLSVMYYTTATALENSSKSDLRQIGYGMKHPINALKVGYYDEGSNNISTIASNFEINIVNKANLGKRGEGTSGNAIRHTLWQAIITKEIDATHAERIGNAHEDNSKLDMNQKVFDNMASADASADLHNNIIGRKIGTNNPKASNVNLAKLVLKEYKEKGLWTVTKINGKYHLQRTKISQKQYELGVQEINKKNNYGKNK